MIQLFTDNSVLVIITYILSLLLSAHAVVHIKNPQSATGWAFMLFLLPYITLPFYMLFSHLRFKGFIKAYKKKLKICEQLYRPVWNPLYRFYYEHAGLDPNDIVDGTLKGTKQLPIIGGHEIKLLKNGRAVYDSIMAEIEQAEEYILISYFLVRYDSEGTKLRDLLIKKAHEGVVVYFLFDEQGCHNTDKDFWRGFKKEENIRLSGFNAINGPRTMLYYNFRNHRKLVVVDGKTGFTGGLNWGGEYVDGGSKFEGWRDTHIRFTGPAVLTLQMCFCRDWYWATGEILSLDWSLPSPEHLNEKQTLQVIPTQPQLYSNASLYVPLAAIHSAKKRIWITSPYFIPIPELFTALKLAVLRGIEVKILLPKDFDHFHTYFAGMTYIHEAKKAGIDVYFYEKGFMHQKTFLIDYSLCNIGSLNIDYRSVDLNFEIMTLSRSQKLCIEMEEMLLDDLNNCIKVKGHFFKKQPIYIKTLAYTARLFSPIL